jgi:branched-chain amino acid transport system substrate-binding protein
MVMRARRPHRLQVLILVVAATSLAAAACSSSSSPGTSASASGPIVVGFEAPFTGTAAAPAKQEQEGWNLGLKIFGNTVDGHKIVTDFTDTQGNPAIALSDARSLVLQKHIQIMEGPLLASEDAAVAPFLGAQDIPTDNLAVCGQTQIIDDARYGNAMASGWLCDQPDIMAADYLYTTLGYRHVTVVANDYAFGWLTAGGFMKQFTMLGGKIDKVLYPPLTTVDFSPYVTAIPKSTQAVFAEVVGAGAVDFTKAYAQYGLRGTIPLYGNTLLFDYSVLPSEVASDVLGDQEIGQYCDGISNPANDKFVTAFKQAYGVRPGYYAEAAYVHAELVVDALKRLHGDATNPKAVITAMKTTPITAPRGPVTLNPTVDAPTQNIYVCKVENVSGTLEDVPIKTYANVLPWGTLPYAVWQKEYATDSTSAPPA